MIYEEERRGADDGESRKMIGSCRWWSLVELPLEVGRVLEGGKVEAEVLRLRQGNEREHSRWVAKRPAGRESYLNPLQDALHYANRGSLQIQRQKRSFDAL